MLPAPAECEGEYQWAGLRPGSRLPFIGGVPGIAGLFVNAGRYRNGLVLAPAATYLLFDQLLGREPTVDPGPFRLSHTMGATQPLSCSAPLANLCPVTESVGAAPVCSRHRIDWLLAPVHRRRQKLRSDSRSHWCPGSASILLCHTR